jgi:hypothetical protein
MEKEKTDEECGRDGLEDSESLSLSSSSRDTSGN